MPARTASAWLAIVADRTSSRLCRTALAPACATLGLGQVNDRAMMRAP